MHGLADLTSLCYSFISSGPSGSLHLRVVLTVLVTRSRHPARSDAVTSSVLVFVVEDEEVIRHLLDEALTDGGFAVTIATNGEEAMAMLDAEGTHYSALITDIKLPGEFSGWEVAKRAREIDDTVPVIYITGN